MKSTLLMTAAAGLVALGGCASSGGGGTTGDASVETQAATEIPPECQGAYGFGLLFCYGQYAYLQNSQFQEPRESFSGWPAVPGRSEDIPASGMGTNYSASDGTITSVTAGPSGDSYRVIAEYDAAGRPRSLAVLAPTTIAYHDDWLSVREPGFALMPGQPGIDVGLSASATSPANPFVDGADGGLLLAANPYALGWTYQSFGVWNVQEGLAPDINAVTFGAPSPASAVPAAGTARFTGKLAGLYVSPSGEGALAAADLSVTADFAARSLRFSTSGTSLSRNLAAAAPAPDLNLSGTLSYAPGSASFGGQIASAGGTLSGETDGRFYGPAAEELGGAFRLRAASGVETFTGGYGAKR
jgi:hypothetical protein